MPTYAERESNARRVAALGAGRVVPVLDDPTGKRVDVDLLRRTVLEVLADPAMADSAHAVGHHLSTYGGPQRAAELITALVERAHEP